MQKNVVITGASSGFGYEMAKIFANDNHNLLLISREINPIQKLNIENAIVREVDVVNFELFNRAVQEMTENFGPIDLLVNNAGIMQLGEMGKQNKQEYDAMININIKGVINGIETVVNDMRRRKTGTIINMASTAGMKSYPEHAVYCGTKFAVMGITETLRKEVAADNVRVTAICPGAFSTGLLAHTTDNEIIERYESWKKTMGNMASPIEVAKMVKYVFDAPQELTFRQIVLHSTKQAE